MKKLLFIALLTIFTSCIPAPAQTRQIPDVGWEPSQICCGTFKLENTHSVVKLTEDHLYVLYLDNEVVAKGVWITEKGHLKIYVIEFDKHDESYGFISDFKIIYADEKVLTLKDNGERITFRLQSQ